MEVYFHPPCNVHFNYINVYLMTLADIDGIPASYCRLFVISGSSKDWYFMVARIMPVHIADLYSI